MATVTFHRVRERQPEEGRRHPVQIGAAGSRARQVRRDVTRPRRPAYLLLERALLVRFAAFLADFLAARRGFAAFLAAFLAAGLALRAAFFAAGLCFFLAGARLTAALGRAGSGIEGAGEVGIVVEGMAGLAGMPGVVAGILMASSQPGVNISSRSREMALARPQRGHRAS